MLRATQITCQTDTGRQRRDNEDNAYARAPLFVVADGMGGAQAGEVASQLAVEAFSERLPDVAGDAGIEQRLADRVREANRRIHERARADREHAGMGTTLTAAYLDEECLVIAHVGDSRAYLARDGRLQRLTRDHSLVGELVERGKLTEEQAAEHPQRSIITRALGPEADVEVDTWTYPVRDGDVLLLCSDGLTSMISEEEIGEILAGVPGLEQAGAELIAAANRAGGRDNITVVLFRVEDVGGPADGATIVTGMAPVAGAPRGPSSGAPESDRHGGTATHAPATPSPRRLTPEPGRPAPAAAQAQDDREARRRRRRERSAKPVAALVAVVVVLALVLAGGYLATRQLYFIGTNPQGVVTIYRGLPYDLPFSIHLYETVYVSGVPATLIPADRRASLLNNDLRSQKNAIALIRTLESGQLAP